MCLEFSLVTQECISSPQYKDHSSVNIKVDATQLAICTKNIF